MYMFFILIIPGYLEYLIKNFNNCGNPALPGIFLRLYYNRNLFYFSIILFPFSYIYNCMIYNLCFSLFSFLLFFTPFLI